MKNFIKSAVAVALSLAALIGTARADEYTVTAFNGYGIANANDGGHFVGATAAGFDATLGTLTRVRVSFTENVQLSGNGVSLENQSYLTSFAISNTIVNYLDSEFLSDYYLVYQDYTDVGAFDFNVGQFGPYNVDRDSSTENCYTSGDSFDWFADGNATDFAMLIQATAGSDFDIFSCGYFVFVTVSVTYEYEPFPVD